jgi:hypothetical protein
MPVRRVGQLVGQRDPLLVGQLLAPRGRVYELLLHLLGMAAQLRLTLRAPPRLSLSIA